MKHLATLLFFFLCEVAVAQNLFYDPICGISGIMHEHEIIGASNSFPASRSDTGVICDNTIFWGIDSARNIVQMQIGDSVSYLGTVTSGWPVNSIAICSNLNGGIFSPTFYSSSPYPSHDLFYMDSSNWLGAISQNPLGLYNWGGNGEYLYCLGGPGWNNTILRYDGDSLSIIYTLNSFNTIFVVADIAVDDSGNVWTVMGDNDTALSVDVFSPSGQLLKEFVIDQPFDVRNAYGCFLANSTLYLGIGDLNYYHPGVLAPITFSTDSAYFGSFITMPPRIQFDLGSCGLGSSLTCAIARPPIITADTILCQGDTAQICASPSFANYEWNIGITSNCINISTAGNYYVAITDSNGCGKESNHLSLTVHPLPTNSITTAKTTFCSGDSARICAPAGYVFYHWNSGQPDSCIKAQLAGNYYVTVTDANGCTAESNHVAITVLPLPPVAISINGDTLSVYGAVTQQWYLNGSAINNAISNIYIATQGGSYTVAVTDTNGCTATSSAVIISGIDNVTEDDVVSVAQMAVGRWQLTVGNSWLGSIAEVFDINGRVVFQSAIRNSQSEISPALSRGVYLLRISSSKSSVVRKLIRF